MYDSKYFIVKNGSYEVLQEDGSFDEYLKDGVWFKTRTSAEKYLKNNIDKFSFEVKVVEVWMR